MTESTTAISTVEYKVILAVPESGKVLMILDGKSLFLPRVQVPKWTRAAEEITRELRETWNLNTCVLKVFPNREPQPASVFAELIDTYSIERDPTFCICSAEDIEPTDLDTDVRRQICAVLSGSHIPTGPFARPGWLNEAKEWIQNNVGDRTIEFTADFRQYNASDTFALVRFPTKGAAAYWLKATGEPNKHEFSVTMALSELFPNYLPHVLAKREDWNAWVTNDAGLPLGTSPSLPLLYRAVEALAEVQIESLQHIPRLEEAGCLDRRLTNIHANLAEMIAYLEEAMGHQTSTKVLPLNRPRLHEIGAIVEDACLQMQALGIPPALVNGDINLDNILDDGSRTFFIDWAEAGIGNPFLTVQQLIQHVNREGGRSEWEPELRRKYKRKWLSVLTENQIERAFVLMPLLTMISYLYGRGDWLSSLRRDDPDFQGFARTLARCMDRAAKEPALLAGIRS